MKTSKVNIITSTASKVHKYIKMHIYTLLGINSICVGCIVFIAAAPTSASAPEPAVTITQLPATTSNAVTAQQTTHIVTTCTTPQFIETSIVTDTVITEPPNEPPPITDTFAESAATIYTEVEDVVCAEVLEPYIEPEPATHYIDNSISFTDSEIQLLAALVYLEGGNEPYECKAAIASTVINRMMLTHDTLYNVLYAPGQFTTASMLTSTTPSDECVSAVQSVITSGTTLPIYVIFFRAGYYHSWSDQQPYNCIGNTYFSYSQATKEANQ